MITHKNVRTYKLVLSDLSLLYGENAEYVINTLYHYIKTALQNDVHIIDFGLFRIELDDDILKLVFLDT